MDPVPRVIAFFDGQNIYHGSKAAFPGAGEDYNPRALAGLLASRQGWRLLETRFYTGIPNQARDPAGFRVWRRRLRRMQYDGCVTTTRRLRYDTLGRPREKGIDVRIALDIVRLALDRRMDMAVIFSQDNDFAEVAREVMHIGDLGGHRIGLVSAYPVGPGTLNKRGIARTDWIRFNRTDWDRCQY